MKIMVFVHGHEALSSGGGERAAASLSDHLVRLGHEVRQISRVSAEWLGHSASFGAFRGNHHDILAVPPEHDGFTFETVNFALLESMIKELVENFRPDIVHIQHYSFWSLDIVRILERLEVPVVMTLHEYLLICHNSGQMVKTSGRLCKFESPSECSSCFDQFSPGEFFLRKKMIKTSIGSVAAFVSPSNFLAQRYLRWGIEPDLMHVIENPLAHSMVLAAQEIRRGKPELTLKDDAKIRFGFFGQINPFKGVDLLLSALLRLPDEIRERVTLGIHGANLDFQTTAYQDKFGALLTQSENVELNGPYDNADVLKHMQQYDWIVVPSVWWENSPVVIQEAKLAGKPVLCSDIGGMSEKVSDGVSGMHFIAGSVDDLAKRICEIVNSRLTESIGTVDLPDQVAYARCYEDIFQTVIAERESAVSCYRVGAT